MTEHTTKSDWTVEQLKNGMAASPIIAKRACACYNALAGLTPEHVGELVAEARTILAAWDGRLLSQVMMDRFRTLLAKVKA